MFSGSKGSGPNSSAKFQHHLSLSLLDSLDLKVTETRAQLDVLSEWIRTRKSGSEKCLSKTQKQLVEELNTKMTESWKHLDSLLGWLNVKFGQNSLHLLPEAESASTVESGDLMNYELEGDGTGIGEFIILESIPKEEGEVEYDFEESDSVSEVPVPVPKNSTGAAAAAPSGSGGSTSGTKKSKIQYQCGVPDCGQIFRTMPLLQVHQAQKHNCENPFPCPYCPKKFRYQWYISNHIIRAHPEEQKTDGKELVGMKCTVSQTCTQRFKNNHALQRHELTHLPQDQRPFKCEVCNKRFIGARLLAAHGKKHTGEKPFKCPTCGKCFSIAGSWRTHLKTHNQPKKRYECDWEDCDQSFDEAWILKRHYSSHFENQPTMSS